MSFTNSTPNYGLPQWLATDKPAFETDMNNAYLTIDNALKSNETSGTSAEAKADSAVATANQANSTAQSAVTAANNAQSSADTAKTAADNAQISANQAQASADSKAPIANAFQDINISTLGTTVSLTFITTGTTLYRFIADVATPANAVFSVNGTVTPAFDVAGNGIGAGFYAQGATVLCTVTNGRLFILSGGSGGGGSQIDYSETSSITITTPPSGISAIVKSYMFTATYYKHLQLLLMRLSFQSTAVIPANETLASIETLPELSSLTGTSSLGLIFYKGSTATGDVTGPNLITRNATNFSMNLQIPTLQLCDFTYTNKIDSWLS